MATRNAIYAQSGGVTAVINASALGCIEAARDAGFIDEIYCAADGINGVLEERLIDLSREDPADLAALRHTPAGAFGSCRRKLRDLEQDRAHFERILEVFAAHDIRCFFYNGGGDSMDTVAKLHAYATEQGYELQAIGIPKTIDNDLPVTDNSPGFGSVAKYNTVSMLEGSRDTESMHRDSTKVFVLETMGRHAGWIAASTGLAARTERDGPHLILLPEVPFARSRFLEAVEQAVGRHGFCAVTVSEGVRDEEGRFLSEAGGQDAFGHAQLGGAGQWVRDLVISQLKLKVHCAVLDYCQRSGRHLASAVDSEQAHACGVRAVALAGEGLSGVMVTLQREGDSPYRWSLGHTDAAQIANREKILPADFIREDGFHVTEAFRRYCLPLIQGEDYPPYRDGLPVYPRLKRVLLPGKLPPYA